MLNISSLLLIALSCISTHAIADTNTCKDDCNTSSTATISTSTMENTDNYTNEDSPDGSY